jgi:peptidyl-prolyl cis-trans isomerase B (cyclophilin B)
MLKNARTWLWGRSHTTMLRPMSVRPSALHRLLCCMAVATLGLALAACGSSAGDSTQTVTTNSSKEHASVTNEADSGAATGRCISARAPAPRGPQSIRKPTLTLDPAKRYVVSLATNCGTIDIQLDVRDAPRTTASFAYLVKRGFYDDLTFHRVAAGFVIQGGDPNGDGSGGPGYTVVEPPPRDMRYTFGTVAMAKTATDPAGASGSQFFIVTSQDAPLPPQYALVGSVVGSFAGVEAISKLPTDPPQDGAPKTPVVIDHATLSSS